MEGSGKDNDGGIYLILEQLLIQHRRRHVAHRSAGRLRQLPHQRRPQGEGGSLTVQVDQWTLEGGIHREPPKDLVHAVRRQGEVGSGARVGVSFQKLLAMTPPESGSSSERRSFADAAVLLADLVLQLGSDPPQGQSDPAVKPTPASDKPTTVVVNDFGWKSACSPSATSGSGSTGTEGRGIIRLSIDEFGFVTEPNGGRYFSFSGSWPIFGTPSTKPVTTGADSTPDVGQGTSASSSPGCAEDPRGPRDASDLLIDGLRPVHHVQHALALGFGILSDAPRAIRFARPGSSSRCRPASPARPSSSAASSCTAARRVRRSIPIHPAGLEGARSRSRAPSNCLECPGSFAWNMQP